MQMRWRSPTLDDLARSPPYPAPGKAAGGLKMFADPIRHPTKKTMTRRPLLTRPFGAFRHREMQQPGGGREGRAMCRFRQTLDPQRAADPHLLVEDEAGPLLDSV